MEKISALHPSILNRKKQLSFLPMLALAAWFFPVGLAPTKLNA
jgi:hypothetical protein